ncbi:hypothetical protein KGF54_000982 [Candida jiufengensis]|uniref:uncharacterized protein n=1 Tax=Candida jiufengensis TaxID=497108 RepID=UPI00222552AA|nr:uncharacterized protein KGF54_000982 [Candida jiufengensis]KAI5956507.1 hypothetical protein KGF54_000982 [Candida jiufengensis]
MSIERFDKILKELPGLPAPGVSGSRIKELTQIAVTDLNKEKESQIIAALYSSCKSAQLSHKLGTLYVVDAISRRLKAEATNNNETVNSNAPEGTYASAVYKIGELIESLIDNSMEYQLDPGMINKIGKLVDIWEKYETFDPTILNKIKDKHFKSTTPPGTPPKTSVEPTKPTSESKESNSILSALASLANTGSANNQNNNNSNQTSTTSELLNNLANHQPHQQHQQQQPPQEQAIFNMLHQMQGSGMAQPQQPQQQQYQDPSFISSNDFNVGRRDARESHIGGAGRRDRSRSPKRTIKSPIAASSSVQAMQANLQHLKQQQAAAAASAQNNSTFSPNQQYQQTYNQQVSPQQPQPPQQQNHYQDPAFVPPSAMGGEMNLPGTPHYRPRNVGFDQTVPQGTIKVLSRTLFLGGVPRNMDERTLAQVLRPFAEIQSVILNSERKHAFVKVYSRKEAEQIITSFNKDNQLPLRTRWGVGFGPRDCCNYQHGISIIPIQRLTEADQQWVVKAQWGGTGGQPISSGMVVDEPDIEIGAGISSKAMSKKMPTNSARNGPKSNRPGEPDEEFVKTTLIQQPAIQMSHGTRPDFETYQQSSVNPLQGLFSGNNNNASPQIQQQQQYQQPVQQPQFQNNFQQQQLPTGMPQIPQFQGNPMAGAAAPTVPDPSQFPPGFAEYLMKAMQQQQQQNPQ